MPRYTIRPADLERDRDDILAIYREVDLYHVQRIPYVFREASYDAEALLERVAHVPDYCLLCAELEGRAVGLVHFYVRESSPYPLLVPRRFVMIDNLAVREEYRRQGIGSALMRAVEEKARELGVDDIRLNVWEANEDARRFYEALKYETLSRTMIKIIEPKERNTLPD